jgi:hypothetical protein
MGVYGDIPRAEAVKLVRQTFKPMRALKEEWTASCWTRTAAKVHCREFERELQWFLASGLLTMESRHDLARALHGDPDIHLLSVRALEPMVDLFSNVFPQDVRSGEIGLLPNGQIPGLEMFLGDEPRPKDNYEPRTADQTMVEVVVQGRDFVLTPAELKRLCEQKQLALKGDAAIVADTDAANLHPDNVEDGGKLRPAAGVRKRIVSPKTTTRPRLQDSCSQKVGPTDQELAGPAFAPGKKCRRLPAGGSGCPVRPPRLRDS